MLISASLSILSLVFGVTVGGRAPSYQDADDPYPMQRYIGSKQPLSGASSYPQAMSHERDHNAGPGRPIAKQSHFEPLFDDFPGPKTKQRIYYPGKGYVEMQVPVQQPDPYSDNKPHNYQSGQYDAARYQASNYDSQSDNGGGGGGYDAPAPSPPRSSYQPSRPSYQAPSPAYSAPAAPTDYRHEDDDSPFDYLAKSKGAGGSSSGGGYGSSASSASSSSYRSPAAPSPVHASYPPAPPPSGYRPPSSSPQSRQPPGRPQQRPSAAQAPQGNGGKSFFSYNENKGKPYVISQKPDVSIVTGGGYGAGSGYSGGGDGGNDDGEVGLTSYNPPLPNLPNPSGYVPSGGYPSSYPDSASTYVDQYRPNPNQQQDSQVDGLSSSFGARSYFEGGNNNNGRPNNGPGFDDHGRGFYDMADQNGQPNGGGPGEQSGPYRK